MSEKRSFSRVLCQLRLGYKAKSSVLGRINIDADLNLTSAATTAKTLMYEVDSVGKHSIMHTWLVSWALSLTAGMDNTKHLVLYMRDFIVQRSYIECIDDEDAY